MALTWEFYVAMILLFVAFAIIVVFVYLLLWPKHDLFDRLKRALGGKKNVKGGKKGDVVAGGGKKRDLSAGMNGKMMPRGRGGGMAKHDNMSPKNRMGMFPKVMRRR